MRQLIYLYCLTYLTKWRNCISILALLLFSYSLMGQGWQRTYETLGFENARAEHIVATLDGGYCLTATVEIPSAQSIAVLKLDAEGNQQWIKYFGGILEDRSRRIFQLPDGGYIIGGLTFNNAIGSGDYLLMRLDAFGNELWSETYGTSAFEDFNAMALTPDGGFLLTGEFPPYEKILLIKVDENGVQEWIKSVGPNVGVSEGRDIKATSDGGYIITGYTKTLGNNDDEDFYIIKVDANGEEVWSYQTGDQFNEFADEVIETQDGGFVSAGYKMYDNNQDGDLYMIKVDAAGDSLWAKTYGGIDAWERAFTLTEAPNGDLIAVGNSTLNNQGQALIVRADANGNELWIDYLPESYAFGYPANILTTDQGFVIAGTGDSVVAVVKTDFDVNSFTTYIQGNIFHDIDDDCMKDNLEESLEGWIVVADGDVDYFSITDSNGDYNILCDTGNYELRVISPNELWATCSTYDAFPLILNDLFDTVALDIPIQSVVDCPHMSVRLSTPQYRRCFDNRIYVEYCNDGTLDEANAYVEVLLDEHLSITSSSLNYTDLGDNLYSFFVGEVAVGECGDFTIDVYLGCDTSLFGLTHCVNAHIYPDTFCILSNTTWDGSSVAVEGSCVGDSVIFEISNEGQSAISSPRVAKIVEDDVIIMITLINLNPGEIDTLVFPSNGSTVRVDVEQSEGHPGISMPSATVEGCSPPGGTLSLGFVTQYPMDDGNHFIDVDCQINVGSYDPNAKSVYPVGYESQHFISDYDELEYHIQFQNTGTDTAFTVVLRDTLSEFLDPTSVRVGVSSHPYNFEILEGGILKFTFENILLPDSTTNLEESNGFVRFGIDQKEGNTPGTIINNQVGIYFDYNAPIITNTVFNTIEIPLEYLIEDVGVCRGEMMQNFEVQEDTVLWDIIELPNLNHAEITSVQVLEHSYSDDAIIMNNGDMFDGNVILNDTVVVLNLMAANGCDSLQTVEITVSNNELRKEDVKFEVYPNPSEGEFFIQYDLNLREEVSIDIFNILGQKITSLATEESQSSGKHRYRVDSNWDYSEVLFIQLEIGGRRMMRKLVFVKD